MSKIFSKDARAAKGAYGLQKGHPFLTIAGPEEGGCSGDVACTMAGKIRGPKRMAVPTM